VNTNPLRVCLDARLTGGTAGGIEQVIIGIANGLSKLNDGDEEYYFLTYSDACEWIRPYIQGPCRILLGGHAPRQPLWQNGLGKILPTGWVRLDKFIKILVPWIIHPPKSDGIIEKANIDIMHFTTQKGFVTEVPTIYQPHDLQHIHLPKLFIPFTRLKRELLYRKFCEQADAVVVMTQWGKQDVMQHYGIAENKLKIVPWAPLNPAYTVPSKQEIENMRSQLALPDTFIFYPAKTWAHKNHIALLEALVIIRQRHGLRVPLVSSGSFTPFFSKIQKRIKKLQLSEQTTFLGFVSPIELQCLYQLCQCMVFPSQFEGWGLPITEAFFAGVPVTCSNATSLPQLVGDAALVFDHDKPEKMAEAIFRLWTDNALRKTLIERGKQRVAQFTWERTARLFRAHYRRIANRPLTEEDRILSDTLPLV
jgi:glycosyltransferase involved in cell wall biosynthesis